MGVKIDHTGKKYGLLTIIKESSIRIRDLITWDCLCDCGKTTQITSTDIKGGNKNSCGCLKIKHVKLMGKNNRKEEGINGFNSLYCSYKTRARKKNIEFNLDEFFFKTITSAPCYYCSRMPSQNKFGANRTDDGKIHSLYVYNGIDRVDNKDGYIYGNVVPCCKDCNFAKGRMTMEYFKNWSFRVFNTLFTEIPERKL